MNIELIQSEVDFLALREQWDALVDASTYPNVFTTFDWQSIWWNWYGKTADHGELFVLAIRKDGKLIGIVPFYRRRRRIPFFLGQHLNFIGFGGRTCPEYLGPIVRQGFVDEVADRAVEFLKSHPTEWDSLFIEDYALDDPATVALAERLKSAFATYSGSGEIRYILPLFENYEEYLKSLGIHNRKRKRLRMNQAKKRYDARVVFPNAENLDEWFPTIVRLTTEARTRHTQASPFLEPDYAGFHRDVLRVLLPQDRALIQFLYFENRPVAVWYAFLLNDKCYAYQQGFQHDVKGSPGDVGTFFLLEHLMERRFKEFDFLRGLEWYKTSFTQQFRETAWMYAFRQSGIAFQLRRFLDLTVKPVIRNIRNRLRNLLTKKHPAPMEASENNQTEPNSPS